MSNNVKIEVLLKAIDQATRPFKHIQGAGKSLSADLRGTQQTLRELNNQAGKIEGFRKTSAQLAVTGQALKKAKQEAESLAMQFRNNANPTQAQIKALEASKRAASELQQKYNGLRVSVQRQRSELMQAGVNTRTLSADERRLKNSISETTLQLNRQRDALARVSAQQARLNAVKRRYQAGKEIAGTAGAVGAAGVGIATSGTMAGVAILKPGYDFAQKNSELQAVLGVGKQSPEMQRLRKQARDIGDHSAASAGDAASAQTIIAKGGGDVDAITAMTPVTLNLSLANQKTMEENAQLLMGTKAAFQLSNDAAAHIGDVLSTTMNKTTADFQGLSDSLSYLAPVAKNAGVSLEQAAAITGTLHDNNIRGSMAGTGGAAVISRLQAPTGKAYDAIKELGVKTTDSKGNTRPIFTVLKEIQASFKRNKLGTGQKAEYVKTIFGEEAMKSATVLMTAAASGKLDQLTDILKSADGKTAELVTVMQDNLGGDFKEFQSAYEAVGTDLFDQQESSLRKLLQTTTKYVLRLDAWIQKNQGMAQSILAIGGAALGVIALVGAIGLVAWPVIAGINAIIAAAGALSVAFSVAGGAIGTALAAISLPMVALGAAIVAGALLVRKYWEPISAFFGGVIDGMREAFAPVAEIFSPLTPMFDMLGEKLKAVWTWFGDLIAPVKASQEALDTCRSAGQLFGKSLVDAIMAPIHVIDRFRRGIDLVLEKLGIIDSKSSDLDKAAEKTNVYATGANGRGYSPTGGILTGGYQPVSAPTGSSYIDQSQHHYEIPVNGASNPIDVQRQIREGLQAEQRERRARLRSNMNIDY